MKMGLGLGEKNLMSVRVEDGGLSLLGEGLLCQWGSSNTCPVQPQQSVGGNAFLWKACSAELVLERCCHDSASWYCLVTWLLLRCWTKKSFRDLCRVPSTPVRQHVKFPWTVPKDSPLAVDQGMCGEFYSCCLICSLSIFPGQLCGVSSTRARTCCCC